MNTVEIGQRWQLTEPNGNVRTFEVTGQVVGRTPGGRTLRCPVARLERVLHDAKRVPG